MYLSLIELFYFLLANWNHAYSCARILEEVFTWNKHVTSVKACAGCTDLWLVSYSSFEQHASLWLVSCSKSSAPIGRHSTLTFSFQYFCVGQELKTVVTWTPRVPVVLMMVTIPVFVPLDIMGEAFVEIVIVSSISTISWSRQKINNLSDFQNVQVELTNQILIPVIRDPVWNAQEWHKWD